MCLCMKPWPPAFVLCPPPSISSQIGAVLTSSGNNLEAFKAYGVFKEIENHLREVMSPAFTPVWSEAISLAFACIEHMYICTLSCSLLIISSQTVLVCWIYAEENDHVGPFEGPLLSPWCDKGDIFQLPSEATAPDLPAKVSLSLGIAPQAASPVSQRVVAPRTSQSVQNCDLSTFWTPSTWTLNKLKRAQPLRVSTTGSEGGNSSSQTTSPPLPPQEDENVLNYFWLLDH